MMAASASGSPDDRGAPVTFAGGGGNAATSIRQPMQHDASQSLPSCAWFAGCVVPPASLWQVIVPGTGIAARATPKVTIRLDSAIA